MLIQINPEQKQKLILKLRETSAPSPAFYVLVTLSTVIAAYGLLANSAAVVIGAMLIAPLMGPIFGVTLGLIRGERDFLLRALLAEAIGVLVAVGIAFLIGSMPLRPDFGSEILARTQPTLFDLLIALFSGLAGAYALVNPKVSPAIAGVAIATALVPPLATCGLCLASGNTRLGLGAFLLFLINFLAIQFSAAIVFMLADLEERDGVSRRNRFAGFAIKFGPGLFLLVILGVFLTNVLIGIITQRKMEAQLSGQLARMLGESQGAQLSSSTLLNKAGSWEFVAEVITPQAFSPAVVEKFEDSLSLKSDAHIHLILRSIITRDCDRNGPVFISDDERNGLSAQQAEADLLQQVSTLVSRETKKLPGALLTDLRRDEARQGLAFTATMQAPNAVAPELVAGLQAVLEQNLGKSVKLTVRTIQTRDADSERFVYSEESSSLKPSAADLALQANLEASLIAGLPAVVSGSTLLELSFEQTKESLAVRATVQAPRAVTPGEVQILQHALKEEVSPDASLLVQTLVQATASADGYLSSQPAPAR